MGSTDLDRREQAFYDEYHRRREREPPWWMGSAYWSLFEKRTLEIGPGTLAPPELDGVEYVAIEYSSVGAQVLTNRGIRTINGNGQHLPFVDRAFDVVACHDVLEHVSDPERFISEMTRVSKHTVIIVGPNYAGPQLKRAGKLRALWYRFLQCLKGEHRKVHHLDPYFEFDEHWESDADALTGVNVWWVVQQLRAHRFASVEWHTEGGAPGSRWMKWLPYYGLLGLMMFVVARRS